MPLLPNRGEVWTANLNPIVGHEQAGIRPVLIVSTNRFNHGRADLVFVIPLTRTERGIPWHVAIVPPEGGLKHRSFALCEKMRSISKSRLTGSAWGVINPATIKLVEDKVKVLLEL